MIDDYFEEEYDDPDEWSDDDDWDDDEWVFDCGDPDCCMNFTPHFLSECYTPEMYEAYVEEVTRDESQPDNSP